MKNQKWLDKEVLYLLKKYNKIEILFTSTIDKNKVISKSSDTDVS